MTQLSPLSIFKRMNLFIKPETQNIDELSKSDCVCAGNSAAKPPRAIPATTEAIIFSQPTKISTECCILVSGGTGAYKPPRVAHAGSNFFPIVPTDVSQG
ncbi:hypothetical protein HG263_14345 [Pseudoalteromonas sp. JBTF-M23]|uniref:Uncharacterized protein n=1 Tax=Pseudoalteromonas caenipelagi TaxID=2726988 RepID=A0A849VGT0_9GAMM|nr:hypothetical protein [Pseudoalteromonas caenipelagi]NOU51713.1 hypothetical protein [Pseudoalteromonas caenipelagi]